MRETHQIPRYENNPFLFGYTFMVLRWVHFLFGHFNRILTAHTTHTHTFNFILRFISPLLVLASSFPDSFKMGHTHTDTHPKSKNHRHRPAYRQPAKRNKEQTKTGERKNKNEEKKSLSNTYIIIWYMEWLYIKRVNISRSHYLQ